MCLLEINEPELTCSFHTGFSIFNYKQNLNIPNYTNFDLAGVEFWRVDNFLNEHS